MSIEIRIADSEEVKAAFKAAIDPLLLENHKLRTLLEASDAHQATLKAALAEAISDLGDAALCDVDGACAEAVYVVRDRLRKLISP